MADVAIVVVVVVVNVGRRIAELLQKKVFLKKYFFRDRRDFWTKVDLLDCCQVGTWSRLRSKSHLGILLCHDLNEIYLEIVWFGDGTQNESGKVAVYQTALPYARLKKSDWFHPQLCPRT